MNKKTIQRKMTEDFRQEQALFNQNVNLLEKIIKSALILLILILASISVNAVSLDDGILAYTLDGNLTQQLMANGTSTRWNITKTGSPVNLTVGCIRGGCFNLTGTGAQAAPANRLNIDFTGMNQTFNESWTFKAHMRFSNNIGGAGYQYFFLGTTSANALMATSIQTTSSFTIYEHDGGVSASDAFTPTRDGAIRSYVFINQNRTRFLIYENGTLITNTSATIRHPTFPNHFNFMGGGTLAQSEYSTSATVTYDELYFWNRALTGEEATNLSNTFYPFGASPPPPETYTTINNTTYNLTSAFNAGNSTIWRTNQLYPAITYDLTPTVKFNVSQVANCTISLNDYNFTRNVIGPGTYYNCSEVDSISQTCTYGANLPLGVQNIYLACFGSNTTNSTSGILKLDVHRNISIDQSTLNLTNAVNAGNMTVWRTNQSQNAILYNSTPRITFNTSEVTNCTISLLNLNYTNLTTSSGVYVNCSNTGVLNQSCIYSVGLSVGIQNIYLACLYNELALSTSGPLSLNYSSNVTPSNSTFDIAFDGNVSTGQNYEYETTVSANLTWNHSLSNNNFSVNFSGSRIDFVYNVSIINSTLNLSFFNFSVIGVYEDNVNGSALKYVVLRNNTPIYWNYSSWYVMKNVSFNVTEINNSDLLNVQVLVNGIVKKLLYGYLNGSILQTRNFSTGQNASAFIVSSTDVAAVYIVIPTGKFFNLTVNATGALSNPVGFDKTVYLFTPGFEIENNTGVFTNVGSSPFVIDSLASDLGTWTVSGTLDTNNYSVANKRFEMIGYSDGSCGSSSDSGWTGWGDVNINDYDVVGFNYSCEVNAYGGSGPTGSRTAIAECALYLGNQVNGLGTNVEIDKRYVSASSTGVNSYAHFNTTWLIRSNSTSNVWNVTSGTYPGTYVKQVTLVNQTLYFLTLHQTSVTSTFCNAAPTASSNGYVNKILLGGHGGFNNGTSTTYGNNFSVVSEDLFVATQNISGAILYSQEYTPGLDASYSINYFLSANNGSSWELAVPGTFHRFTNTGRVLRWKVNGTSTNTTRNFGVTNVRAVVISSSPNNVTIDLGADNIIEANISGVVNYSSVITVSDLNLSVATYMAENCDGLDYCTVPISVRSSSAGEVAFTQLITRSSVNPIILSNLSNSGNLSIVGGGGLIVNLTDYKFKFIGDLENVTIKASIFYVGGAHYNASNSFNVRFSPFNLTSVKNFMNFFPKSRFSYNLSPDGQKSSVSFWNVTSRTSNHSITVFANTAVSLNACTPLFIGGSLNNRSVNISGGVRGQPVYNLTFNVSRGMWATLDYINCSQGQPVTVVFNSLCIDCVKTVDYDSGNQSGRSD